MKEKDVKSDIDYLLMLDILTENNIDISKSYTLQNMGLIEIKSIEKSIKNINGIDIDSKSIIVKHKGVYSKIMREHALEYFLSILKK